MNFINIFDQSKQDRLTSLALLLSRIAFGASMLFGHGIGKWGRFIGDDPIKFADPLGVGPATSLALVVFAEAVCSALVMLGLLTRWAAIPLFIAMSVAAFVIHGDDPFSKMEKSLLYAAYFLSLFFMGAGRYSLDALILNRSER